MSVLVRIRGCNLGDINERSYCGSFWGREEKGAKMVLGSDGIKFMFSFNLRSGMR